MTQLQFWDDPTLVDPQVEADQLDDLRWQEQFDAKVCSRKTQVAHTRVAAGHIFARQGSDEERKDACREE